MPRLMLTFNSHLQTRNNRQFPENHSGMVRQNEVNVKDSEIIRKAAELVAADKHDLSCIAIWCAQPRYSETRLSSEYKNLFAPQTGLNNFWLDGCFDDEKAKHEWRITALLFFSEYLKSEGR